MSNMKSEALTRAKSPKLGRFIKDGPLQALQSTKLVKNLKEIGKAFKTALEVDNKAVEFNPEEREAYNEEMMRQIAIENDYRGM
mgnify:FL=1